MTSTTVTLTPQEIEARLRETWERRKNFRRCSLCGWTGDEDGDCTDLFLCNDLRISRAADYE